ncbi:UNVERIFIED_CONTAM: hypothetical protein FKN15_001311 [Acipenser sinensis]
MLSVQASHGDVRQAIGFLTGQDPDTEIIAVEPSDSEGSVVGREGQTKVIDLTGNDKDDLQTAIELSLKESQTAQAEEQDLSRALEASVADNKSRVKRKRCEAWGDSSNPIDWIRRDEWPVGLKNVGNTCWFSAVIQVRRIGKHLLVQCCYTGEMHWETPAGSVLLHSNPKDKQENPMVQLFYGTFLAERTLDGKTVSNIERFGQYPLQVNGFNNLDECLEGAMVEGEIEALHSDQTIRSGQEDIKATSPASTTTLSTPTDPVHEQTSPSETENSGPPDSSNSTPTSPPPQRTPIYKPFTKCRPPMDTPPHPAPHKVSEEELCFIKGCLHRWRTEVEQNIQELKDSIDRINHTLENMHTEDSMCQVPYRLHAVLVHEGQASAGHYWAYIFNHRCKLWLKYNDISVTESCWEELERDSYGGVKNASAYCLMYIDDKLPRLIAEDTDMETGQVLEGVDSLPPVLRHYVQEDNRWFQQEVEEWEEEQFRKIAQKEPPVTVTETQELSFTAVAEGKESEAVGSTVECEARADSQPQDQPPEEGFKQAESQVSEVEIPSVGRILVRSDADGYNEEMMLTPAMQGVILAIAKAREVYDKDGPEAALIKAFHEEYSRLYLLAQEKASPQNDPRLQHVLVYLIQNEAPNRVVERTLLEQFADRNLSYDERSISIMKQARAKLRLIGPEDMDMDKYRQKWHEDYSLFRKVFVYLLTGLEQYQNGKVREALTYLVYAYQSNSTLLRNGENRGVEESLIALYRRKCLMELNENAAGLFDSGEDSDVVEGMSIMNDLVIPCMHLMISHDICQEDLDAIEIMRDRWCSYLGTDMDDRALHRRLSGSEPAGFQSALPGKYRMSVSINTEDLPTRYHRPSRSEQASTKWHPGPVAGIPNSFRSKTPTRSINSVQTFGSEKMPNQRCKLIGDDRQLLNSTNKQRQRYVTKDGKCRVNLGKIEDRSRFLSDIFTTMVDLKYRWFLFIFMMCYVVTWVLFAGIYFLDAWLRDDVNHTSDPKWRPCVENIDSFLSALLFSIESQRTIGYGYRMVTSNCSEGVILIMAQSIIGSMIDALMVGCIFVKISRPKKRAQTLIFSKSCVISHRDEELCLMFRIGDLRDSHMVDAKVRAKLIKSRQTKEGEFIPLEQSELNLGNDTGEERLFLVEPQIICHTINESSPFWDMSAEGLKREQFEIIVILEGIVEATGMTCQARTSYKDDEIVWGHRFEPCMSLEKGAFRVDYSRFEKTFDVQTPPSSAKEMQALKDMERNEMSALSLYWDHMGHTCTSTDLEHRLSRVGIGDITEEKSTEMIDSDFEV